MVRLKGREFQRQENRLNRFQFQYGSIKRLAVQCCLYSVRRFQFQYGSIKSITLRIKVAVFSSFNSNMVRLKGCVIR